MSRQTQLNIYQTKNSPCVSWRVRQSLSDTLMSGNTSYPTALHHPLSNHQFPRRVLLTTTPTLPSPLLLSHCDEPVTSVSAVMAKWELEHFLHQSG